MIIKKFDQAGDFSAYRAAEEFCRQSGYSVGSMCGHEPTGLMKGDYLVAKWKNLTPKERRTVDGKIEGDFRNGPVKVTIYQ